MRHRALAVAGLCLLLLGGHWAVAQSVSRASFKKIAAAQEMMEAERFREAIAVLEELVRDTADIPYDNAIANQYLAHCSVMLDNVPRARTALKAALASSALTPVMEAELKLFYGTVLLGDEDYPRAAAMLEDWLALAPSPEPKQLFSVAYANYMSGNLPRAEELVARTVEEGGANAQDSWYHVYYRVLNDQRKYGAAEQVLYQLVGRDPSKALHWRMLASHYLQLDKSSEGLAAIMVSYLGGAETRPEDLRQIVALYGFIDVPEKAARLLQGYIDEGRIEADAATKKQLGNLWLMARERDKAKEALTAAASVAPDGNTYAMLGGIYFEDEDWREAYDSYREALRLGGVKEVPRIHLLAGISAMRAGMQDEARSALREAARTKKFRAQANGLIKQLDSS